MAQAKVVVVNNCSGQTVEQNRLTNRLLKDLEEYDEDIEKISTAYHCGIFEIDILIKLKNGRYIIVECDENQHMDRKKNEELTRINEIFKTLNDPRLLNQGNILVIRFNPDYYNNKKCFKYNDKQWSKEGDKRYKELVSTIGTYTNIMAGYCMRGFIHVFIGYDDENKYI